MSDNYQFCPATGKRMYSERVARSFVNKSLKGVIISVNGHRKRKRKGLRQPTRAYYCKACKAWHVTSHKATYKVEMENEKVRRLERQKKRREQKENDCETMQRTELP